jgi:hypothetical protein
LLGIAALCVLLPTFRQRSGHSSVWRTVCWNVFVDDLMRHATQKK